MIVIDDIGKYLTENDIKPSVQRLKIFDFLLHTNEHPTVDLIYNALSSEIPTLSKTTVYNTLRLFQSKGIVNVVNIEDNQTRYDADTSFHGHFKCNSCGRVYDFAVDISQIKFSELDGFQIKESHYYLKGICKDCLTK